MGMISPVSCAQFKHFNLVYHLGFNFLYSSMNVIRQMKSYIFGIGTHSNEERVGAFRNSTLLKKINVMQKIWILETENDMYQDHVILHFALFNLLGDDNL